LAELIIAARMIISHRLFQFVSSNKKIHDKTSQPFSLGTNVRKITLLTEVTVGLYCLPRTVAMSMQLNANGSMQMLNGANAKVITTYLNPPFFLR